MSLRSHALKNYTAYSNIDILRLLLLLLLLLPPPSQSYMITIPPYRYELSLSRIFRPLILLLLAHM